MNKEYELNGLTTGFALWVFAKEDFLKNSEGKRYLFKSLDLAKVYAANDANIKNPYDYKVWLILEDEEIDFDVVEEFEGYYEYFSESTRHFIIPKKKDEVLKLGYFVFENGDRTLTDKEYGRKRGRELYGYIREALSDLIKYPYRIPAIDSIYRDSNGHMCASLKDSTCKIHVCYNNQIMTLNQERKELGIRCLPYEKSMDKFVTIYTYITKDIFEPKRFENDLKAIQVQQLIVDFIKEKYPESEPRYIGVNFNGNIFLED